MILFFNFLEKIEKKIEYRICCLIQNIYRLNVHMCEQMASPDSFRPWFFNIENFNPQSVFYLPQYLSALTKTDIKYWSADCDIETLCDYFCTYFKSNNDKMEEQPLGNYLNGVNELSSEMSTIYNTLYDFMDIIVIRAILHNNYSVVHTIATKIMSLANHNKIIIRFMFYVYFYAKTAHQKNKIMTIMIAKLEEFKLAPNLLLHMTIAEVDMYIVRFKNILETILHANE